MSDSRGGCHYLHSYTHAATAGTELIAQTSPDGDYAYTYGRSAPTVSQSSSR